MYSVWLQPLKCMLTPLNLSVCIKVISMPLNKINISHPTSSVDSGIQHCLHVFYMDIYFTHNPYIRLNNFQGGGKP